MKLHPYYYGPASASDMDKGRQASLQRQYAKVFDIDELGMSLSLFHLLNVVTPYLVHRSLGVVL